MGIHLSIESLIFSGLCQRCHVISIRDVESIPSVQNILLMNSGNKAALLHPLPWCCLYIPG